VVEGETLPYDWLQAGKSNCRKVVMLLLPRHCIFVHRGRPYREQRTQKTDYYVSAVLENFWLLQYKYNKRCDKGTHQKISSPTEINYIQTE